MFKVRAKLRLHACLFVCITGRSMRGNTGKQLHGYRLFKSDWAMYLGLSNKDQFHLTNTTPIFYSGTFQCPGYYKCRGYRNCLSYSEVCDGIRHCPDGDDELFCGELWLLSLWLVTEVTNLPCKYPEEAGQAMFALVYRNVRSTRYCNGH